MKIISTAVTTLGAWASLVSADRAFDPTESRGDHNMTSIKTAARFGNGGAKIELCPSGDCDNGQLITLSMSRLEEIDNTPKMVQQAKNFNALDASWSDFEPITVVGIDAMSTSFVANFTVGKAASPTWFNLTATIYADNGTAMNGNQTIDVPAGSLKFSVAIKDWPFSDKSNRLQFGVYLKARGKNNANESSMSKKAKGGNHTDIDRVDMGEGMFMDAPTLAVVDGTDKAINSTITVTNKIIELAWVFPSFTQTMFYDPVMGSEDTTTSTTTSSTTNTTESPSPTASVTPTPTPTSASTPTPTSTPTSTPATTSGTTTHLS